VINTIRSLSSLSINIYFLVPFFFVDRSERIFSKTKNEDVRWNTTNVFEKSRKALENNSIVILKGRKGTGKTTLAIHLASDYINRQYKLAILDRQNAYMLTSLQKSNDKYIIILEEWFDAHSTETTGQPSNTHSLNAMDFKNKVKIIITVTKLETNDIEKMSLNGVLCEDNLTNLDEGSAFPDEFKKSVLSFHMKKHKRELNEREIERIVSTETYYGFPFECSLFCSISMNFNLGSKYFRQPSVVLMDEINALRNSASENEKNRNMYSVMVYILLNHENGLNITNIDIHEIEKIASQFILGKGVHIPKPNISDAWREMAVKYLQSNENKNEYSLHPVVYQAVLISYSELFCEVILERCNLLQLLDVVTPPTYEKLEGEMVLSIEFNQLLSGVENISHRMADACLSDKTTIHLIVQYIKRYQFSQLFRNIIKHLETKINMLLTKQRVENIMNIFEEIMDDDNSTDKNLVLLDYTPNNFTLTWAIIVLQKSEAYTILETLVDRYLRRGSRDLVVDILRTVVDEYGNSVLHYCILWWENKDNPFIRFLSKDIINIFKMLDTKTNHDIKNTANMSALDFAAFFCIHEVAKLFVRMNIEMAKEFINKEIDTLLEYAINVKIKNYVSYPWINMDVCGNIHIRINDTFDFDKTSKVLKELKNSDTI
jgi:energy-coupling factor transporter ATP-binding protein EcfA2